VELVRLGTWAPRVWGPRAVGVVRVGHGSIYASRRDQLETCTLTLRANAVSLVVRMMLNLYYHLQASVRKIVVSKMPQK
jgi:hypothetical protein